MAFVATTFYTIGYVAFLGAILGQVPSVSGWNFDRMLTLFAVSQMVVYLSWSLFRFSLSSFSEDVRNGDLDAVLKLPIDARFVISFKKHNTDLLLPLSMAVIILIYSLRNTVVTIPSLFIFILLFICGFIIFYNLLFAFTSLSFWLIEGRDLAVLFEEIFSYSRYPAAVFPKVLSILFSVFFPVLLIVYVPVSGLLNMFDWKLTIWSVAMVFLTWFLSQKIWQAGLRHYSSASS
jgi:ABC-type uncharacterized transport system permease subunit